MKKRLLCGLVFAVGLMCSGTALCEGEVEVTSLNVERLAETDTEGKTVYLDIKVDVINRTGEREVQVPIKALDREGNVVYMVTLIGDASPDGSGHISGHADVPKDVYEKIHRWEGN